MFSKKHSTITKGILIILMLAHHVFFPDNMALYEVNTILKNPVLIAQIVTFFKICVAGFSFISAFGITRTLTQKNTESPAEIMSVIIRRLIRLESGVVIIYIFAILYKYFVMHQPIGLFYAQADMDPAHILLSICIDGLGLAAFMGTVPLNVTWWYLSYAVLLIVVMPFIYMAYRRFRYLLLPAACMVCLVIPGMRLEFWCYLPTVFLGCAFAYENWFEKLREWGRRGKTADGPETIRRNGNFSSHAFRCIIKTGKFLACLFLLYLSYLLSKYAALEFSYLLVFVIPYMAYEFIACIPGLNFCLEFLGKHAANIFLVHTFIYYYFYPDFIYSFQDSWKILAVLLTVSLAVSIIVESFKKYTGYSQLTEKLLRRIN